MRRSAFLVPFRALSVSQGRASMGSDQRSLGQGVLKRPKVMELWDIKPGEEWQEILDEVSAAFGIHTILADAAGNILLNAGSYNPLCSRVRKRPESLTFVCSQTNRRIFHLERESGELCNDFCEIGLFKTAGPVFSDGQFLGGLWGCGVAAFGEPWEGLLVAKTLDIDEEEASKLIKEVHVIHASEAKLIGEWLLRLHKDIPAR